MTDVSARVPCEHPPCANMVAMESVERTTYCSTRCRRADQEVRQC